MLISACDMFSTDFVLLMCAWVCADQEMAILKAEFGHHAEKLDEYEQMRQEIDRLEGKC